MAEIKTIGILTSGGDGPGMNAAIRSLVRCALARGVAVKGIRYGYQGLLDDDIVDMDHRSVANIINRGGTILKTARCPVFKSPEGVRKGWEALKSHGIDALVVIGGDGSYRGARDLYETHGFPVVTLPGTIDNDLCGTDRTIGCRTAVNTALEALDKVRDTAFSMERVFVIEVMGNHSGYIAMQVAIGAGAEDVIIPEREFDYQDMYRRIQEGRARGKASWMIVVAEGAAKAPDVAAQITQVTGLETRFVVLGHVQRGGCPIGPDRILATRLGSVAVDLLLKGVYGKAVGEIQDEIHLLDLKDACRREAPHVEEYYDLLPFLR